MIFRLDFVVQVAELNKTCSVRITIVAERQQVLHIMSVCVCMCSLSYPACNAYAPYYIIMCGLSGCRPTIFSHVF
jgi:hypothetical protein